MRERDPLQLTPRQKEILALVAEGWTNKAIAHHLGISPKTVDAHLSNIYRILRVSNRAEAVKRFLKSESARSFDRSSKGGR